MHPVIAGPARWWLLRPSTAGDALPLIYESINSCIAFVGSLHGCQLITVEDLASDDGLHPVQQAMVDNHGSQCGFCTPGFIMSMFALYQHQQRASSRLVDGTAAEMSHTIDRYLGGNLCRCTGYRPIKSAMVQALEKQECDSENASVQRFRSTERQVADTLNALQAPTPVSEAGTGQPHFYSPDSLSELASLRQRHPDARLLAGGTDLALEVTQFLKPHRNHYSLEEGSRASEHRGNP